MKALAVHANSDGVTTPDQIAADQAEMDSSIQTIDRIAKTTKFSGEQLINGNKDITYEQNVSVRSTQNNKMLNARESSFSQIFKRDGYEVTIGFGGACGTVGANGVGTGTNFAAQAMKAYFEVDTQSATHASDLQANHFNHDQQFTVTGNKGSRQIDVAKGQHIGTMVNAINVATDATGVAASLVFNSSQTAFVADVGKDDEAAVVTVEAPGQRRLIQLFRVISADTGPVFRQKDQFCPLFCCFGNLPAQCSDHLRCRCK